MIQNIYTRSSISLLFEYIKVALFVEGHCTQKNIDLLFHQEGMRLALKDSR